ncbi:hypothetical protein LKF67_1441 [Lactococcus lactis subsp. lactis]|uniref:hypothetical protein n=1 Tax=Lactococcus lactis TaxID=1358 RepID=UPI0007259D1F|nr:hypothetical protein [Lactococcus lactis]KST90142.1 hypothetical protein LKF67_1441 [Lactococcus lactis subsp. lactis]
MISNERRAHDLAIETTNQLMDLQKIAGFKPNSSEPMNYFDIYKEQYKIALEFVNGNF